MRILKRVFLIWGIIFAIVPLSAQKQDTTPVFTTQVNLAVVSFRHVEKGKMTDLRPEDIVLLEDGNARKLTVFEGGPADKRTVPIEITWLVDRFSVKPYGPHEKGAKGGMDVSAFHAGLIGLLEKYPTVFHSIYGFDTELWRFAGPTRSAGEITRAIQSLTVDKPDGHKIKLALPSGRKLRKTEYLAHTGNTGLSDVWLYESIGATLSDFAGFPGNAVRALVAVSFGHGGTDSGPSNVVGIAKEAGIPIYPIVLGYLVQERSILNAQQELSQSKNVGWIKSREDQISRAEAQLIFKREFASLGKMTGGEDFLYENVTKEGMTVALRTIEDQILHQYIAGFSPEVSPGAPKKHTLEIKLVSKGRGKIIGGKRTLWY